MYILYVQNVVRVFVECVDVCVCVCVCVCVYSVYDTLRGCDSEISFVCRER